MNEESNKIPLVFPTQNWSVGSPLTSVEGSQPPGPNSSACKGNFTFHYYRDRDDNTYCQKCVVVKTDNKTKPWIVDVFGDPQPVIAQDNNPLRTQAPPAVVNIGGRIYLFFTEMSDSSQTRLFYTYTDDGQEYGPISLLWENEGVVRGQAPAVAFLPAVGNQGAIGRVMLAWPGAGNNGYFYRTGWVLENNSIEIKWENERRSVPNSFNWFVNGCTSAFCGMAAYKSSTDNISGFILLLLRYTEHSIGMPPQYDYGFISCDAYGNFSSNAEPEKIIASEINRRISICELRVNDELTLPVFVDENGSISNLILSAKLMNDGYQGEWLSCGLEGGGTEYHVSVGIPPSISISTTNDSNHEPPVLSPVIYSSNDNGGGVFAAHFKDPIIGNNSVGICATAVNYMVAVD